MSLLVRPDELVNWGRADVALQRLPIFPWALSLSVDANEEVSPRGLAGLLLSHLQFSRLQAY